jgi:hypothetical protein
LNWLLNVLPWGWPALTELYRKMSGKEQPQQGVVFKGPVHRTENAHRTELDRTSVRSFFRLRLPTFGVSAVAGCLILEIFENRSKTGCNQLRPVFSRYIKYYICTRYYSHYKTIN